MPLVTKEASVPVRYHVAMPDPRNHEYAVRMEIPAIPERGWVVIAFSAWAPGSYMVRDFVRHVYDLDVRDERGRRLAAVRLDKQRWRIESGGRALSVRYRVFAFDVSVRTSFLDETRAFWNGTSLFFAVEDELARPCEVDVEAPRGWHVSTALEPVGRGGRRFAAADYDALVDAPFEVGTHEVHAFRCDGTRFEVAWQGRGNADVPRVLRDLERIVDATGALFGGFPFSRYLFIVHCLPARGGGLEHAASCTLDIAGFGFDDDKGYKAFNELAAHEFFHAWNVKRIRDRVLGPFDYGRENHTRLLWFHEGFTEYMESIVLLRAGLIDAATYLSDLASDWPRYAERPGRNVTPLSELSFEAWIKLYKPAENHINRAVSYYEKGKWAALVLELLMRDRTDGKKGVTELFRWLWQRHARRGHSIGVDEIRAGVRALTGDGLLSYFRRYIDGTDELPVPRLLAKAGVRVAGRPDGEDVPRARRVWTGLTWNGGDRAVIKNVVPDSPAYRAGLTFGDEVIAVGGTRVNASTVGKRFADGRVGERVRVVYFRRDELRETTLVLRADPGRTWEFSLDPKAAASAKRIVRGWLGSRSLTNVRARSSRAG